MQKARYVADNYSVNCFADDTGLEIVALENRPGVYSARYAGDHCSPEDNMDKVLSELEGEQNRMAKFRTVIALILDGEEQLFEGEVLGEITETKRGDGGFGYDPVFLPKGYDRTFAQIPIELKNEISHRGKAVKKFSEFIRKP